ncbi:GNAT family N-acetyltransferase [Candidatus Bathyarchaeota archaeon]|nr:GNAT family N-acetyltransferase [Candidatus Bathyarchaeota archaeon]
MDNGLTIDARIVPISEEYIEGFHNCLETVAGERKYLGYVKAPSLEQTRETVLSSIQRNIPQYIALLNDEVIGWCEVLPNKGEGFTHSGKIDTMGVLPNYRGQGIGKKLIDATLSAAEKFSIERVELLVYASNFAAINFYEKIGFVCEGKKRKARKLDGEYDDIHIMAIFLNTKNSCTIRLNS